MDLNWPLRSSAQILRGESEWKREYAMSNFLGVVFAGQIVFYYRDSGFVEKCPVMETAVRNYFLYLFSGV